MRHLGLALYAEGTVDELFLPPLLRRLCDQMCTRWGSVPVEVSEVPPLSHPVALDDRPRAERIAAAAREALGAWQVLFVHADADGDARAAREERVEPAFGRLVDLLADTRAAVAVVPVRETEAWALMDTEALRDVFGLRAWEPDALREALEDRFAVTLTGRDIESLLEPKMVLNGVFDMTRPTPRVRREGLLRYLPLLGEGARLERLSELQAFSALERELGDALERLGIIAKR